MASPRDIRRRIRSISNTAQITRAMQMVAASKMRKAQQAAIEVRPFVQLLYRIQRKATTRRLDFRHPPLEALAADRTEFLFEPNADDIIGYLLGHYLNIFIHLVLLNAKASEQSARMVSMKNATDNADGMIKHLTLEYNKLRQGHITQELLEIVGGQA